MTYEDLLNEADDDNIEVLEINYKKGINGLCVGNIIGINKNLTDVHKKCVLAEEIGHYHTNTLNILDQKDIINRKLELKGRRWGYEKLVSLKKLIEASFTGVKNLYELAECLDITEDFLKEALQHYSNKYGLYVELNEHCIYFNPLSVVKYNYE